MSSSLITGTLGGDVFLASLRREELTEDLLRSFRDYFEYELRYTHGLTSDITINLGQTTRLRIDQSHDDARHISISELDRLLDKSIAQYLLDRK